MAVLKDRLTRFSASAFIREDVSRGKTGSPSKLLQAHFDIGCHGNLTGSFSLGVQGTKGDKSPLYIDTISSESDNFAKSLSKLIGCEQSPPQTGLGLTIQSPSLLIGQYTIPFIVGIRQRNF